jgi:pyrimidine operon attenuation protein/uracil phosphoribosyltransferase
VDKKIILSHQEIEHRIKRIAYQIYETFIEESDVVIAGISQNGFVFANKIADELEKISEINVSRCEVFIDKENIMNPITTSLSATEYSNKGLVLVDDVLNSGKALIYGVKHFLDVPTTKFKTAVLVDRNHKRYPVKTDFKGISLSTSLLEKVTVIFEENNSYAYLN